MLHRDGQTRNTATHDILRDYCIRVIRFVSDGSLDPHLYFEKKLTGDVTVAESSEELIDILIGLIEWIDETQSEACRLPDFDQVLNRDGLPSLSLLRAPETRLVGLVLARGRIRAPVEYRLVDELTGDTSISDADRYVAERLLADHEQI